jgi:multimeric flavodoxin WrbA
VIKKKAIILNGSPRKKGNSAILSRRTAEGLLSVGAKVETFFLHNMNIKPCTACEKCRDNPDKFCVIDDDMQILYPKILQADALVIAGPVYWFSICAQTKLFLDRCYAFGSSEGSQLANKRIGIILTYGGNDAFDSGAVNALRTFQDMFNYVNAEIVGMVHGPAFEAGEIRQNEKLMHKAFELGRELIP